MINRGIEARFKDLEREVLALKTAHRRGLGVVDLFKKSIRVSTGGGGRSYGTITITAEFTDSSASGFTVVAEPLQPYPITWSIALESCDFFEGGAQWQFFFASDLADETFDVTSTEQLKSVSYSVDIEGSIG